MSRNVGVLLVSVAILATACGQGALEAPMVPTRTADHETRSPRRIERPHLIAPPPAYGNKVVMAKAGSGAELD